ncbi:MAG: bifunctional DNA primase/polymerase [Bacteroidales bacterium]|jgi:hypothetical protein|nr:bifunctional DNA primase/polymerase [Bacteroidales bacterium]HPM02748.1 bifunctional DNA primase/polymerase [Candidatus Cloacimonadota bacterium]
MIEAFEKYHKAGFASLPTGKDKMPAIPKGESWKGGWVNKSEYALSHGIALIAGKISGGLECLDFDNHFGDAKQVLQEFSTIEGVTEIVKKYSLPIQSTVSGGFHLLYRCDLVEGNQKLASRIRTDENGRQRADVLIETRGEGGYFVVSPTPGYNVIRNNIFHIPYITSEDRAVLLSACRTFNKNVKVINKAEEEKDTVGNKFNNDPVSLEEMISTLKDHGWKELKEGIWQRPDKKKGISATLGKAYPGIFYNFSSSGHPFEQEKGYTAFQVIGLLKYNGDFKQFAKDLHQRYQTDDKQPVKFESQSKETKEKTLDAILEKSFIDLEIPVAKPPVILRIKTRIGGEYMYNRVFTLGNFSAVTGKSKSKKTFLTTLFLSSMTINTYYGKIFLAELPKSKSGVVLFDTEQSNYDAYVSARRVWDMVGKSPNFGAFDLREYSPFERCEIIDRFLVKGGDQMGFIVIDGIADLANAINDEIEASRVVTLLMKWTKKYNVHICTVIHQNKNDNYATGHLGSSILKKAECVISVTKDESDNSRSEVSCDLIRGTYDFDKFSFIVNEKGLPEVEFTNSIQQLESPFINSM